MLFRSILQERTIRIWNAETGTSIGNSLEGHTDRVWSVVYSPDGRHIISGTKDCTIRIWDAETGTAVGNPLEGHTDRVWSVAYSPDGQHIISGSADRTIRIWDADTGTAVGNPLDSKGTLTGCCLLLTLLTVATLSPDPTTSPFESGMQRLALLSRGM